MPLDHLLTLAIASRMAVVEAVRVRLDEEGQEYLVVAGRQRVRCTRWLNDTINLGDTQARILEVWPNMSFSAQGHLFEAICEIPGPLTVEVIVDEGSMGDSILNAITENKGQNRETIDSSAAKVCAALREGVPPKAVAAAMRSTLATVDRLSRFFDLHKDVQEYLRDDNGKAILVDVYHPLTPKEQAWVVPFVRESDHRCADDIARFVGQIVRTKTLPELNRQPQYKYHARRKFVKAWIEHLETTFDPSDSNSQVRTLLAVLRGISGDWDTAARFLPEDLVPPAYRAP